MSLKLMYITNSVDIALIAEKYGVDRIMIDLETLGKEERQKNMNTVKSHHSIDDVRAISAVLTKAQTLVRINPWHENSLNEIESSIDAGAEILMLPMWKTMTEVNSFLKAVNNRVQTVLLLETKEAAEIIDEVLEHPLINEIHIGLNDLHLSYGLKFMFELLSNGVVEGLCAKFKHKGIKFGFGGIAKIGEGLLPAERIVLEHYRLGSTRAILSRSFCNTELIQDRQEIENIFSVNMLRLRNYEKSIEYTSKSSQLENKNMISELVKKIVETI